MLFLSLVNIFYSICNASLEQSNLGIKIPCADRFDCTGYHSFRLGLVMRPRRNMVKGIQNNPAFLQKGQTSPLLRQKLPSAYGSILPKGQTAPCAVKTICTGYFECVAADDIAARKQLLAAYIVSHGQIPSCPFRRTHQPFTTFPLVFAIHYNRIRFIKQSEFYQVFTFFSVYAALSKLLQQQTEASHRAVREKPLQRRTEKTG